MNIKCALFAIYIKLYHHIISDWLFYNIPCGEGDLNPGSCEITMSKGMQNMEFRSERCFP